MRKIMVTAALSLQLLWWMPVEQANAIVQKPEPLRLPPVILLLEDTPYYDNIENDYPQHPAGMLAPQDVQVLEGQNGWVNELTAVLKVGERIVWKQEISVKTGE